MAKVRLYWRGTKAYLDWAEAGERFRRSIRQPDVREAERIRAAKDAGYATTEKYYAHLTPDGDDAAVKALRY